MANIPPNGQYASVNRLPYVYDARGIRVVQRCDPADFPHLSASVRDLAEVVTGNKPGNRNQAATAMISQITAQYAQGMAPAEARSALDLLTSIAPTGGVKVISSLVDFLRSQIWQARLIDPYFETFTGNDHSFMIMDARGFVHKAGRTRASSILSGGNQDAMALGLRADGTELTVVGDGIGGAVMSQVASEIFVSRVCELMVRGYDFESAVAGAAQMLKSRRVDIVVNHILDNLADLCYSRPDLDSATLQKDMNAIIDKDCVSTHQLVALLKNEIKKFINLQSFGGKIYPANIVQALEKFGSNLHSQVNKFNGEQHIFQREPGTTLVVSRKWQKNGRTWVRDISIGDSGAALFEIDPQSRSVGLVYQTRPNSLVRQMFDSGIFADLADRMTSDASHAAFLARQMIRTHPAKNIVTAVVDHQGIVSSRRHGGVVYDDTGDVPLTPGRIYVRLAYTDLLPGTVDFEVELAPLLSPGMNAQEILTVIHAHMLMKCNSAKSIRQYIRQQQAQGQVPQGVLVVPETHFNGMNFASYFAIDGLGSDDTTITVDVVLT